MSYILEEITVPANGVKKIVDRAGCAVQVAFADAYTLISDYPSIFFDGLEAVKSPVRFGETIQGNEGKAFDIFTIEGTTASEGNTLLLLVSNVEMEQRYQPPDNSGFAVDPGPGTRSITSTDAVQTISNAQLINSEGVLPRAIVIQARLNDIAYAIGADPDQAGFGHLLVAGAEPIRIENGITDFRIISATAATPGEFVYTAEFIQ